MGVDTMKMTVILTGVACALLSMLPVASGATIHWTPAHHLAPQGQSNRMSAGDLDGDGDIDLSLFTDPGAGLYWNTGTPVEPTWQYGPSPYGGVPPCVQQNGGHGDVDGDGDLDLAVTCWYDDFVRFYWNVGSPASPVWEVDLSVFEGVQTLTSHRCPRLADMDDDGDLDAMICVTTGRIQYVQNVGSPAAPAYEDIGWIEAILPVDGGNPTIALGDLDSDGDLDIIRISYDTEPECFENVGTPSSFAFVANSDMLAGIALPASGYGKGVELMDIDADGDPDMILARGYGENLLFLNEGTTPAAPTSWGVIKAMYR